LSPTKVYKTIPCKMITTVAGVGGDPQLFKKQYDFCMYDTVDSAVRGQIYYI